MAKAKNWKIIFFIAGILIFGYMIYAIGIDNIGENIRKTGWWFFPIIGIWIVVYTLNALSWNAIVCDKKLPGKEKIPFLKMLKLTISGYSINYITPVVALGGEPYRILETQEELGTRRATSSVLSYSMMHILSHVIFWMCSIVLIIVLLKPSWGLIVGCAVTFLVFAFLLYFIFRGYKRGLVEKIFHILGKIPFIKKPVKRFTEKNLDSFNEIDRNIVNLSTNRKLTFYSALFLEISARIVSCFEIFFIARAVDINMSLIDCIVLYAGSTLFSNIMFFSPMQLGTREGGLALTLKIMGYSAPFGIYVGLIMRIRELFWIGIGLLLMRINYPKNKKYNHMRIKGIIFDYGGTLDTNGVHWFEIFCEAYEAAGLNLDKEVLRKAYVFAERKMENNEKARIKPGDTFHDNLEMKVGCQVEYLVTNGDQDKSLWEKKDFIVDWCYCLANRNVSEAILILKKLKEKYPLVLVSNFYGNLNSVLKDYKIDGYFDKVIESSVVGIRKPNPDIFQKGIEALCLKAEEVVVIGDSYKNDVQPAQLLGCATVWLKGIGWEPDKDNDKKADYIIKNLSEVLSII